eukprot:scaffold20054_cov125-Isochrysis_galbana.AAC.6
MYSDRHCAAPRYSDGSCAQCSSFACVRCEGRPLSRNYTGLAYEAPGPRGSTSRHGARGARCRGRLTSSFSRMERTVAWYTAPWTSPMRTPWNAWQRVCSSISSSRIRS